MLIHGMHPVKLTTVSIRVSFARILAATGVQCLVHLVLTSMPGLPSTWEKSTPAFSGMVRSMLEASVLSVSVSFGEIV